MSILGGVVWEGDFLGGMYHFCRGYILFLQGVRTTKKIPLVIFKSIYQSHILCNAHPRGAVPGRQGISNRYVVISFLRLMRPKSQPLLRHGRHP